MPSSTTNPQKNLSTVKTEPVRSLRPPHKWSKRFFLLWFWKQLPVNSPPLISTYKKQRVKTQTQQWTTGQRHGSLSPFLHKLVASPACTIPTPLFLWPWAKSIILLWVKKKSFILPILYYFHPDLVILFFHIF